jgi:hypothetical protein
MGASFFLRGLRVRETNKIGKTKLNRGPVLNNNRERKAKKNDKKNERKRKKTKENERKRKKTKENP